jgi:hypothetical protein
MKRWSVFAISLAVLSSSCTSGVSLTPSPSETRSPPLSTLSPPPNIGATFNPTLTLRSDFQICATQSCDTLTVTIPWEGSCYTLSGSGLYYTSRPAKVPGLPEEVIVHVQLPSESPGLYAATQKTQGGSTAVTVHVKPMEGPTGRFTTLSAVSGVTQVFPSSNKRAPVLGGVSSMVEGGEKTYSIQVSGWWGCRTVMVATPWPGSSPT